MAEDLEAMLSQMSDKFDESFADQEPSYKLNSSSSPSLHLQMKNQLKTQPQTPIKQQIGILMHQKSSEQRMPLQQEDEIQNKEALQNGKSQLQIVSKYETQATSSQQKIVQNIEAEQCEDYADQNLQIQDKAISLEDEMEDEQVSYQSLTQKFEVALSRLKHTQSANQSQTQFAARQENFQRKKTTGLNLMRVQKEKQVAKLCPAKPLINSRSQQLLINHKPIHTRYQAIVDEKKKKIETQVAQKLAKIAEEEEQELSLIKEYQQQIRKKIGNQLRSQQEYYSQMKNWVQARNKKVQDIAEKKKEEVKNEATFKPQINPKSEIIIKKSSGRVPVYDKIPLPRKIAVDSNCTFKPNLNKTSKK